MNNGRAICFLFVGLLLLAGVLAVFDATGIPAMIEANRARAEADRAIALAQLEQARGDLAIKEAAAAAVRADTAIATAAALWPVWAVLGLVGLAVLAGAVAVAVRYAGRRDELQAG